MLCPSCSAHDCSLCGFFSGGHAVLMSDDYDELRCMISVLSAADLRLYSRRYRGRVHASIASHQALVRSASRAVCAMPVALTCATPCPISTTQL